MSMLQNKQIVVEHLSGVLIEGCSLQHDRYYLIVPDGTTDTGSAIFAIGTTQEELWERAANKVKKTDQYKEKQKAEEEQIKNKIVTVAGLIAFLQTKPQDMPVAYCLYSEQCLLDIDDLEVVELCKPRIDGWIENKRSDKPSVEYLRFPGN